MNTDELITAFLNSYSEYSGWTEQGFDAVSRKLCEEYVYGPNKSYQFGLLAFGWMWGKTGDYVEANCVWGLLKLKLDEVYKIVAQENNWND
jgi:hypothetical protein